MAEKMKLINTKTSKEAWLRALVFGASGSGKTYSIRSLPLDRVLLLLVEPKHLPLKGYDIDAIQLSSWDDMRNVFSEIREDLSGGGLTRNGKKKDIVVIDSLSEVNELCKKQIISKDRPELLKRQQKKDVGGIYDEQMMQNDWGLLGTRIDGIVSAFCHLPCHIIITALERWTEEKATKETFITPSLNGALAMNISHHFDEAYRIEVEDNKTRWFRTQRTSCVIAKGSECLDELEEPNWTKVMTKIFAGNGAGKNKKEKEA